MLKVLVITVFLIVFVMVLSWCKVAGRADRWEEEHREEFDLYKWCDDDCYMCNFQKQCQRAVKREEKV